MSAAASIWLQPDGAPVSCTEKLRVLEENRAELAQMMQDAFEDAVLMGVDPTVMRGVLVGLASGVKSPRA